MMFPNWLFGRIGYSLSELQHAEDGEDREHYIQDIGSHAAARNRTLEEQYQNLSAAYSQLLDYTKSIEQERFDLEKESGRLREGIEELRKVGDRVNEEIDSMKGEMEKLRKESANLSYAYARTKRVLALFSEHADVVFGEGFPAGHRERLVKFLQSLP